MKLKTKLVLPSLIQAALIAFLLLFIWFAGSTLIETLQDKSSRINKTSEDLNRIVDLTNQYFVGTVKQHDFSGQVALVLKDLRSQDAFDAETIVSGLQQIDEAIKKADALRQTNISHVNQILKLTALSMKQSDDYIKLTVDNLIDPNKRSQVSDLERMVISGAAANTSGNLRIQVLLHQMMHEFSKKDDLLGYLQQLLENVDRDVEALKGTPFAGMAVAAKQANEQIVNLVTQYVANYESIQEIESEIHVYVSRLQQLLSDLEKQNVEDTFGDITGLGVFLGICLLVLTLVLTLLGYFFSRVITKPMLALKDAVRRVVQNGDFSGQIQSTQRDEVGQTVDAFNLLIGSLNESINGINRVMSAVDHGDFTQRVTGEQQGDLDRLKQSINSSIEALSNTIHQVVHSSRQISNGSSELSSSAQALASGTTEQAASLEEISATMDELKSQATTNNDNAVQASALSGQTIEIVNRGNQQMEEMLRSMDQISQTSADVSKIIKVIDEIAFQTNLLALNAAVEAARAGKYGKGFAVVAEEVRNLAARSAEAARSSTEMIEKSGKEVQNGVNSAGRTAAVLNEINQSITKVNDLVAEIATASNDQSMGIDEVNKGLSQINSVVQQNSSISEETASASEELNGQAAELEELMRRFRLDPSRTVDTPPFESEMATAMPFSGRKPAALPRPETAEGRRTPASRLITLDDDDFGKY